MQKCPECGTWDYDAGYVPRNNSDFEDGDGANARRQSRCPECNSCYGRRRNFVNGRFQRLADAVGVRVEAQPRSVYRIVNVLDVPAARTRRRLDEAVTAFNASLPPDRSNVDRHGIRLALPERARRRHTQLDLFSRAG
jgi:hypothetical protein